MPATITPNDDTLHTPTNDDPFWTEALWLGFAVPEHRLTGALYPIFRPNQNICSFAVYVWDDVGVVDQDIPYFHNMWHLPLPADLRDMRLPGGFEYRCIEPLRKYEVHYDDGVELHLDLLIEGMHEPVASVHGGYTTGFNQSCHVTGHIRLNGEGLDIDCYELRGCGWFPPRPDVRPAPRAADPEKVLAGGAAYAASAETAFMVHSVGTLSSTKVMDGYLLRDGRLQSIVEGERIVKSRDANRGSPAELIIDAVDDAGRSLHAVGTCVNRVLMQATPGMVAWACGTNWNVDGEDMWGEDHESPGRPAGHFGGVQW
jgi:hypothetical protein